MCGLIGFISNKNYGFYKKHEDTFSQLLFVDQLRGEDSTGVVYVEDTGDFGILKEASPAAWVGDTIIQDDMLKRSLQRGKALLGHNRKATIGKVTDDTAHPFVIDNTFTIQHNGTLTNHKSLADTTVDSEAFGIHLKAHLNDGFDKEKFEEAMGKVYGAYAVVCYNQENHTVYIMRNDQRPLSYAETPDGIYYASEWAMLAWILGRNGYDVSKCNLTSLKAHTLLTIPLETCKISEEEFTPKKPVVVHYTKPAKTVGGTVVRMVATVTHGKEEKLSKNAFKRFRKQYMGTRIAFVVEDYVETTYPQTIEGGATDLHIFGTLKGEAAVGIKHTVDCRINLPKLFGETYSEDDVVDESFHGKVYDMTYDKNGMVTVFMDKIMAMPKTTVAKWNATSPLLLH